MRRLRRFLGLSRDSRGRKGSDIRHMSFWIRGLHVQREKSLPFRATENTMLINANARLKLYLSKFVLWLDLL